MLQEFRVDNFKSLINIVFKPQEINLLLGQNNSFSLPLIHHSKFALLPATLVRLHLHFNRQSTNSSCEQPHNTAY